MAEVTMDPPSGGDDTGNFNSHIAAAGPGGTVNVPAGNYQFWSAVNLSNASGVSIIGEGVGSSLTFVGSDATFLAHTSSDCLLQGLRFSDARVTMSSGLQGILFAQGAQRLTIRNCRFEGGGHQICLVQTDHSRIASCTFVGLTMAANCVFAYLCTDLLLTDLNVEGFSYPASSSAPRVIQASRCQRVDISRGSITNVDMSAVSAGMGLALSGTNSANVIGFQVSGMRGADGIGTESAGSPTGEVRSSNVVFDHCTSTQNGNGTTGNSQSGSGFAILNADRVTLANCPATGNGTYGARPGYLLYRSADVTLVDCRAEWSGGHGVVVSGSTNVILENVVATSNRYSGLYALRDTVGGANSALLKVVGGDFSTNNRSGSGNIWERQGIYLADATSAQLLRLRTLDFETPKRQEYGVVATNQTEVYGLSLDLGGNLTGNYLNASSGTVEIVP